MKPTIEVVAIDCLMVRLFESIAEDNMPWMLSAAERLRQAFGTWLIDLVPSYTTLMLHYDLHALAPSEARALIDTALAELTPLDARGREHVLPVWYDPSVGPELALLSRRSGLSVAEVIECHSQREYQVFALGFAPDSRSWGWCKSCWQRPGSILHASAWQPVALVLPSARPPRTRWSRPVAGT